MLFCGKETKKLQEPHWPRTKLKATKAFGSQTESQKPQKHFPDRANMKIHTVQGPSGRTNEAVRSFSIFQHPRRTPLKTVGRIGVRFIIGHAMACPYLGCYPHDRDDKNCPTGFDKWDSVLLGVPVMERKGRKTPNMIQVYHSCHTKQFGVYVLGLPSLQHHQVSNLNLDSLAK